MKWLVRGIVGAIAGLGSLVGCGDRDTSPALVRPATSQPGPPTVDVETATPAELVWRIPIVGTLYAAEEAVISTKTAGILRRTYVDVGNVVTPDAPLAQVDEKDYLVAAKQAEAALNEVLARLGVREVPDETFDPSQVSSVERAAAQLANARFTYERLLRMSTGGPSQVSDQELNDAATRLRVAEADHRLALDSAAALVATARERQSQLQLAQQRLADALTRTPPIPSTLGRAGAEEWVIAARLVTEGQYLNAADQLYRLIISDPLKLRSKVPERYARDVRVGQRVELDVVGSAELATGEILRVSPAVDPASRTFEIEALVDNAGDVLKPGAFARGVIVASAASPVLTVPLDALITAGGTTRLYVVEDGVARERSVQVGRPTEGRVEVLVGLRPGEHIVARGGAALTDGAAVVVRSGS